MAADHGDRVVVTVDYPNLGVVYFRGVLVGEIVNPEHGRCLHLQEETGNPRYIPEGIIKSVDKE